ncbi:UDP-glucosyltransferase, putative [Ricinus communis]|uniref:UDP-glucosyltransferase, putative n=1 Tax=Ricinus communis TaxID=3988 RepID=B9S0A2_RICCO|nr:UDP-glucosyltransferase, putative [Ricinus communis]
MANQTHQLHFLLAPLMSQSHLIPFTDMAKLLAQRGLIVTIIMTPINADRYSKIIELAKNSNLRIQFLTLQFLGKEVGLPEDVKTWIPFLRRSHIPFLSMYRWKRTTGGFLTHCGWNSTLEGVSAGLAMITWPMFAEQFHNAKMINEVLKTGVKINGVEEENHLLVKNEDVKIAIEQLMGDGEEGKDRRRRAKELGKMAKNTVEEGGSSYSNITHLIQYVREHVTPN